MIDNLKVGYHVWASKNQLLLFVLGDSSNTLHLYDISKKTDKGLATNIGRSLHKIPGENAMSFIQIISEFEKQIKKINLATGEISLITNTMPGQEYITWLQSDILLAGRGTGLFIYNTKLPEGWQPVFLEGETSALKGITRIAVNENKTKLAVVISE